MEGGSWRPVGQGDTGGGPPGDWRSQLQPESRQRIVNKLMETLQRHLPIPASEGLTEFTKIAVRFEENIYTAATSQTDYLQKISLKMLSMETKTQNPQAINPSSMNPAVGNQSNVDAASLYSTAQTGNIGVVDWQEEIYQKIKAMKELHYAELNELYQKLSLKFQQCENQNLLPHAKQSEQIEKMKSFKIMLERSIAFLQLSKSSIQPGLKEKLPLYQKQISNFLASDRKPRNIPQSQFQPPGGHAQSMPQQQSSQVSQLQQHDGHVNQVQQMNLQGSVTSMQQASASIIPIGSMPVSTLGVPTAQQNISNTLQSSPNIDPIQGSSFGSLQPAPISSVQQSAVGALQNAINVPQHTASLDSTAQTCNVGVVDWQEEIYQKIKAMKELYFAELNELYQKLALKLQQCENQNLLPHGKQSEQIKKMKSFKVMLERSIAFLQLSKSSIQPGLKEKLPVYQRQITTFLASNRKPRNIPPESQFQPPGGHAQSMPQQQSSQVS